MRVCYAGGITGSGSEADLAFLFSSASSNSPCSLFKNLRRSINLNITARFAQIKASNATFSKHSSSAHVPFRLSLRHFVIRCTCAFETRSIETIATKWRNNFLTGNNCRKISLARVNQRRRNRPQAVSITRPVLNIKTRREDAESAIQSAIVQLS